MGGSRSTALRMEKRFKMDPKLRDDYSNFMLECFQLGHMEKVPESLLGKPHPNVSYLPHHSVRNESSETAKQRVVFNGSIKTSTVRWRSHRIVFSADIPKMYRQIKIN